MNKTKLTSLLVLLLILVLAGTYVYADTIVVYGATGKIGSKIVTEALDREHKVIGVSRNPKNLTIDHQNFSAVAGDHATPIAIMQPLRPTMEPL